MEKEGRWNFAYALPQIKDTDNIHIVISNSIQMGWVESMCVFCTASETARDVAEILMHTPILKLHPLEHIIVPKALPEHAQPPNISFLKNDRMLL